MWALGQHLDWPGKGGLGRGDGVRSVVFLLLSGEGIIYHNDNAVVWTAHGRPTFSNILHYSKQWQYELSKTNCDTASSRRRARGQGIGRTQLTFDSPKLNTFLLHDVDKHQMMKPRFLEWKGGICRWRL